MSTKKTSGGQVVSEPGHADLTAYGIGTGNAPDFSGIQVATANPQALDLLRTMAVTLRQRLLTVAQAQAALEVAQSALAQFQLVTVPDAMQAVGVESFTLDDGVELRVKSDVKVNITEANRADAHQWFRDHGHGAIIKRFFLVDVRSLTDAKCAALRVKIAAAGVDCEAQEAIHNATLKSLVNEILTAGTTLPPSVSVFQYKKAELKESKARK